MEPGRAEIIGLLSRLQPSIADKLSAAKGDIDLLESGLIDSMLFLQLLLRIEEVHGLELELEGIDPAELGRLSVLAGLIGR